MVKRASNREALAISTLRFGIAYQSINTAQPGCNCGELSGRVMWVEHPRSSEQRSISCLVC